MTHYVIDRRAPLKRFLRSEWIGKAGYLDHATVQRREGVVDEGDPEPRSWSVIRRRTV